MASNYQYDLLAIDGIRFSIAETWRAPKKVTLPLCLETVNYSESDFQYDFSLEKDILVDALLNMEDNEIMDKDNSTNLETLDNVADIKVIQKDKPVKHGEETCDNSQGKPGAGDQKVLDTNEEGNRDTIVQVPPISDNVYTSKRPCSSTNEKQIKPVERMDLTSDKQQIQVQNPMCKPKKEQGHQETTNVSRDKIKRKIGKNKKGKDASSECDLQQKGKKGSSEFWSGMTKIDGKGIAELVNSGKTSEGKTPVMVEVSFQSTENTKHTIRGVKCMLEKIVKNSFSLQINNVHNEPSTHRAIAILTFVSKAQAWKFLKKLRMSTEFSKLKGHVHILPVTADDIDPIATFANKLASSGDAALKLHQVKIGICREKLTKAKTQGNNGTETATQAKLYELLGQQDEYNEKLDDILRTMRQAKDKLKCTYQNCQKLLTKETKKLDHALPMYAHRRLVLQQVEHNQVCVLLGETGSGKSTQIPIYLFEEGYGNEKLIVCTQPRKVAALTLARHVSKELEYHIGKEIGYRVGREERRSHNTKLIYMTDHSLLNECIKDPTMSAYSVVIIDEAHERSIYTDLLLGMLHKCLPQRPDLHVIITSATIDPDVFVRYFGGSENCPVINVPGRLFPVDIIYKKEAREPDHDHVKEAVDKVIKLNTEDKNGGDILVFLATPAETERAYSLLTTRGIAKLKVMQLHGRLQPAEQQAVFDPVNKSERKVVFATNVAETSVTIPGIHIVVDAGLAKEKKYDAKRNMGVLELDVITQSSANQRKGRAGRTGPGKCFRLYTQREYDTMGKISKPEIFRVHLGHALLKLMELGIHDPLQFKFVESPSEVALQAAMDVLAEIGAVENRILTELGHKIAKLSVEPRLGKTILCGIEANIGLEMITIAAFAGTGSSIFYRGGTPEENIISDQHKLRFCSEYGDMATALNVYKEWESVEEKERGKWCMSNSINGKMMKILRNQTHELRHEIKKELGLNLEPKFNEDQSVLYEHMPEIILRCYPSNLSRFTGHSNAGYIIPTSDMCVHAHPGSALNSLNIHPKWFIFGQLLKTSRDFAINLTPIKDDTVIKMKDRGILDIDENSLKEKVLEPYIIPNLSDYILRILAGPRHQTRKGLQDTLSMECARSLVVIDLDFTHGTATTYTQLKYHANVENLLGDKILQIKNELRMFRSKYPMGSDRNSSTSAMVESGGAVQEILMPNEFITFKFDCNEEGKAEELVEQLNGIGKVFFHNTKKFSPTKFETNIEFKTADEAGKAVAFLKENYQISAYTGRQNRENHIQDFQVKLTWERRPIAGHAIIKCKSLEDARAVHMALPGSYYGRMRHKEVDLNGKMYKVLCPKPTMSDIRIVEIGKDTIPEKFKQQWMTLIRMSCPEVHVNDVWIPRNKGFQTSPAILTDYERKVVAKMNLITQDFHIDIPMPKDGAEKLTCWVTLQNAHDREDVMDRMFYLQIDERFEGDMRRTVVATIYVANDMMKVVEADLKSLLDTENLNGSQNARCFPLKSNNWRINITSDSIAGLVDYKTKIEQVIAPTRIDCSQEKDEQQLLQPDGRTILQNVEKETGTRIITDFRNKTVVIYGTMSNRDRAVQLIDDHVKYLAGTIHDKINLSGPGRPIGLMKALLRKYGAGLDELKMSLKLYTSSLNLRRHELVVRGTEESISELKGILDAMSMELGEQVSTDEEKEDCSVCLCPADEDLYRLMLCGHLYCKSCVENLVRDAITNGNIPIKCCNQMCDEPIVLKDIQKLMNNRMGDLVKVSLNCYIMSNKDKVTPCPTPDCPTVYKLTLQACLFNCPACRIELCTKCGLASHTGLTCEQNKSTLNDGGSVKEWLEKDKVDRGRCPSCTAPIERIDGCNHIACTNCKKHVCWKCKIRFFDSMDDCYRHLRTRHDGFYD